MTTAGGCGSLSLLPAAGCLDTTAVAAVSPVSCSTAKGGPELDTLYPGKARSPAPPCLESSHLALAGCCAREAHSEGHSVRPPQVH